MDPVELRPPAWNVALVLQSLTGAPYEPLRTCDERFLAQKTPFLLPLASTKLIGELHALSYRVFHSRGWGEVSFFFVPGFFVEKTQDPSSLLAPRFEGFTVPALPNARNNHNGRLLRPVRAVRHYLDCTAAHRPRCERLFVTAGHGKKDISNTSVSFGSRRQYHVPTSSLVRDSMFLPLELGKLMVLLCLFFSRTTSLSTSWRRHTTFKRHYLRDLAQRSLDTFHLAAQALV